MPKFINKKNEILAIEVKEGLVYFVKAGAEIEIPEVTDKVKELVNKGHLSPVVEEKKVENTEKAEVKETEKTETKKAGTKKTGTKKSSK